MNTRNMLWITTFCKLDIYSMKRDENIGGKISAERSLFVFIYYSDIKFTGYYSPGGCVLLYFLKPWVIHILLKFVRIYMTLFRDLWRFHYLF